MLKGEHGRAARTKHGESARENPRPPLQPQQQGHTSAIASGEDGDGQAEPSRRYVQAALSPPRAKRIAFLLLFLPETFLPGSALMCFKSPWKMVS